MSRFGIMSAVMTPLRFVASFNQVPFILAATLLVLSVTGAQARNPSFDEVVKATKALRAESCEIIILGMGERELFVKGTNFEAVAKCADKKSYTFILDENFKILSKKVNKN